MNWFGRLYDRVLRWSAHPRAPYYLAGLSFAESSFFPIPPDVMLAPMSLAKPERAWRFALLTTVASVAGGALGYAIGYFMLDLVQPLIGEGGRWAHAYARAAQWFENWGFWAVLVAGFSPIPYKVFTIAAGALAMPFLPFMLASALGRGGRFFLVAGLIRLGGERMERALRANIDALGWLLVGLVVVGVWLLKG